MKRHFFTLKFYEKETIADLLALTMAHLALHRLLSPQLELSSLITITYLFYTFIVGHWHAPPPQTSTFNFTKPDTHMTHLGQAEF